MEEIGHLSADLCRRFLEKRVSAPEKRAFVRHLVTQCEDCLGLLGRIVAEGGYWFGRHGAKAYAEGDYDAAFQAASKFATRAERRIAVEHLRGWGHWSALEPLPPNERFSVVIEHKDWHHWGLFRALLDAARLYRSRDPQEAADIATLALEVVEFLSPYGVGDEAAARDMRAKAFAVLADCRRITGDLDEARHAIAKAWRWNGEGMGDPLDKAYLWRVDASYAAAVGELETAEIILEKALSLYLAANERHLQGRTLIQMGETVGYANPNRGIAHIEHGLQLINAVREPRIELRGQHHLAEFLCLAQQPQEALAVMNRARPLYRQFEEAAVQLRLHWLQGQIARGLGKVAEAVEILRLTRDEYRALDLRREFALVTIDQAEAHVGQGKTPTAIRLLSETTPALASWNLHHNGLAAWLLSVKSLRERREPGASAVVFERLRLYFRRYWLVPGAELRAQ